MKWNHSFFRFLLVGVLNTLVGLSATYLLLNVFQLSYYPSTFLGNAIGAVVSFFLNKTFTFKSKGAIGWDAVRFVVVILVCYGVSYTWGLHLTKSLLSHLTTNSKWVENGAVLVGAGFYTITNYLGQRFFTFRTPASPQPES
ncbi:MAG: GtrA family protein [Tumebacillaceae bacterium]